MTSFSRAFFSMRSHSFSVASVPVAVKKEKYHIVGPVFNEMLYCNINSESLVLVANKHTLGTNLV